MNPLSGKTRSFPLEDNGQPGVSCQCVKRGVKLYLKGLFPLP